MNLLELFPKRARIPALGALLVPSLLLVFSASMAYRSEQRLLITLNWVTHTHRVEASLLDINARKAQLLAEYPLAPTGRTSQLRDQARRRMVEGMATVMTLTADNPMQHPRALRMEAMVTELIRILDSGSPERQEVADGITQLVQQMWEEEERLLKQRQESLLSRIHLRTWALWGMVAFNAGLIVLSLWLTMRMARLERLVTMCAWTRTIHFNGKWISFEEYLRERFSIRTSHGISPEEADRLIAEVQESGEDGEAIASGREPKGL